jgi:hypothetical protein
MLKALTKIKRKHGLYSIIRRGQYFARARFHGNLCDENSKPTFWQGKAQAAQIQG